MTANVYGITLSSLLDWVNVQAAPYGADPTGTTDSTSAIAAAITAANGGVVYFPSGTYLLNSSALSLATAGTVLMGAAAESTKLVIGSAFTDTAAVKIAAYNCQVRDLSIDGASSTTTSNPVANAIEVIGVRRAKVNRCTFFNINGWAIEATSTTGSSGNPFGMQVSQVYGNACAGGIHVLGNSAQGYAVNSEISDAQFYLTGVTTGASANLDAVLIEDAWDVLLENTVAWMSAGTGASLHIKGNSAASFITNLDGLGSHTGPCVLIEDGPNGTPQNTQIQGGVIQQGAPGLLITGGAYQTHISTSRIINNQTHGIQVSGTGKPVHIYNCFFNLNGAGASGTNYDLNWAGTAQGKVMGCWFGSGIVATGTAGVQQSVNIATAGQSVLFDNVAFQGSGASSSNWFTNLPAGVVEASGGAINFATSTTFTAASGTSLSITGGTNGQRLFGTTGKDTATVAHGGGLSTETFDRFRLTTDGVWAIGPGTATRDTFYGRAGAGVLYTSKNFLVGGSTPLGDNGVGELQLANATTVPTTPPTGGALVWAQGGVLKWMDTNGTVWDLSDRVSAAVTNLDNTNTPADQGFSAWTVDPSAVDGSAAPGAGGIRLGRIILRRPTTISYLWAHVVVAGATLTAGQCFLGLYTASGTRVAVTADQSSAWTATGTFKTALTSSYSAPAGTYYVALLANGTTIPQFAITNGGVAGPLNANLTASTGRSLTGPTGQTSLPASITMSSNSTNTTAYWFGTS